jgi:hypothetical protein
MTGTSPTPPVLALAVGVGRVAARQTGSDLSPNRGAQQ